MAAVAPEGVHWLQFRPTGSITRKTTALPLPMALACVCHHPTGELIIICRDGRLVRLALPETGQAG